MDAQTPGFTVANGLFDQAQDCAQTYLSNQAWLRAV
jgi:hypothetical protein